MKASLLPLLVAWSLAAPPALASNVPAEPVGPRAISTPAPTFDASERQAGHAGKVLVQMTVTADGTVAAATVASSSGWPALDARAIEAAKQWRFEPARDAAGKPVAAQVQVPFVFASDTPAPTAPPDPIAQARATSCATFLSEVSAYRLGGDALGGGHFGTVWGGLLADYRAKYGQAAAMAKVPIAKRVFENTVAACRRAPARSLGAAVEAEFYQVR